MLHSKRAWLLVCCLFLIVCGCVTTHKIANPSQTTVDVAIAKVKPALVRIQVVSTSYRDGREIKYESSGSGVIITKEGHVITNHHVVGKATQILCILSSKEELEAELVGKDPLTDIAVIQLKRDTPREYPFAVFGDSSALHVGDQVLAMGSPLALSQSVTLGIVSNTEVVLPKWFDSWGGIEEEGENVGALVKWVAHDAEIYGGNSGGPLVNLAGEIIGINEIRIGLGGAIPGNLAKEVAEKLIADGCVRRAWIGLEVQTRLKHSQVDRGILVSGTIKDSPAAQAGFEAGDILIRLAGQDVNAKFREEIPTLNRLVAGLKIGEPVEAVVLRDGKEYTLSLTPIEREIKKPKEHELKEWGITVSNISLMKAKELKRERQEGVLVTSFRPGGPTEEAKPGLREDDIIVSVNNTPVDNVAALEAITQRILETHPNQDQTPTLVEFERKTEKFLTIVKVGIRNLIDPGLEVKKAWLPVKTQIISRDMAKELNQPALKGFRVTKVYSNTMAETAGIHVGDIIVAVDDEPMTASAPEDYEELPALIRQYPIGTTIQLAVLRDKGTLRIPVELMASPKLAREMKKYRDDQFEFTVRDVTFFDRANEKWKPDQGGVMVEEVKPGGWAALGQLGVNDLIVSIQGNPIADTADLKARMKAIVDAKPKSVVLKVIRGIHTQFLELEPKWDDNNQEKE